MSLIQILNIVVIENDEERRRNFQSLALRDGIRAHGFRNVNDFINAKRFSALDFAGLVIGLETSIGASTKEKDQIREVSRSRMPLLEVSLEIGAYGFENSDTKKRWDGFVLKVKDFVAGQNRTHARHRQNIKVQVITSDEGNVGTIRTVTADISEGGCFLVSTEEWPPQERITLVFDKVKKPIVGRVAWVRKWESINNELPGYGVQFLDLDPENRSYIESLLETT